jgi:hypothetical protein
MIKAVRFYFRIKLLSGIQITFSNFGKSYPWNKPFLNADNQDFSNCNESGSSLLSLAESSIESFSKSAENHLHSDI